MSYVDETLARVRQQNPDQPEFNQAVYECEAPKASIAQTSISPKR